MSTEKQRQIEERAYALWQAEGRPHGKDEEHWHRAAREVEADDRVVREAERAGSRRAKLAPRSAAAQGRKPAKV